MVRFTPLAVGFLGSLLIAGGILFYLFTLRQRNREIHFLRGFYVSAIIMITSFVVRYSLYSEGQLVYIAELTTDMVLFGVSCFVMFLYTVHKNCYPREAVVAAIVLFAGSLAFSFWNFTRYRDLDWSYSFELQAHYIDFATGLLYGIFVLGQCVLGLVVAVRKFVRLREDRRLSRSMLRFAVLCVFLIGASSVFAFYETGVISRVVFDQLIGAIILVVAFAVFVLYVNAPNAQAGLAVRLVGYPLMGFVLVLGLVGYLISRHLGNEELDLFRREARITAEITESVPDGLRDFDEFSLSTTPPRLVHTEPLGDDAYFGYDSVVDLTGYRIVVSAPWRGGRLWVSFGHDELRRRLHRTASVLVWLMIGGTAVLAAALPLLFRGNITVPIGRLTKAVRGLRKGDTPGTVPVEYSDEIGLITAEFNRLVDELGSVYGEFEATVDSGTDMIVVYGAGAKELHRNPAAAALPATLPGIVESMRPTDAGSSLVPLMSPEAFARRSVFQTPDVVLTLTGAKPKRVAVTVAPTVWRGEPGTMLHIADMTDEATKEAQQEQLMSMLTRSDRLASLGMLLSTVSHDIQTPLHTLRLAGNYLSEFVAQIPAEADCSIVEVGAMTFPEARRLAVSQAQSVRSAVQIISEITEALRSTLEPSRSPEQGIFDINRAAQNVVRSTRRFVSGYTDHFEAIYGENIPPCVGHETHIQQVLLNLIRNACEALESRDQALVVSTSFDRQENMVELVVHDEGSGIPKQITDSLFEPFVTHRPDGSGSGLGLAICREIVLSHDGTIEVESEPRKGTTFRVRLPTAGA